jgi:sugar O-acyltransferase (sialic acid O-acetyltransferase NeuD family)
MSNIAIYGYGGHAREVASQIGKSVTFFVDDKYSNDFVRPISSFNPEKYLMMIAVADCKSREEIVNRLPKNTKYLTFIHKTALVLDENIKIGEGSFIGAYSILTNNITIGKHTILNRANHIGHDCVIGDYFSAMPGAIVSGNVDIGDRVYLGTNSTVIEKNKIYDDVIIGANGLVIREITDSGTYVGIPVKKIKK